MGRRPAPEALLAGAVGRAIGDERVVCVRPGNCSRTVLDTAGGVLRLVEAPVDVDDTDVL